MRIGLGVVAVVMAALSCGGCHSDWDGWDDYIDEIEANSPVTIITNPNPAEWGTRLVVVFLLKDPQARTVTVALEFSLDGGDTWFTAQAAAGDTNPKTLASDPVGIQHQFDWDHFGYLGVAFNQGVLVRVRPTVPNGTSGVSDPFDLTSYGEAVEADLRADLYADLADGTVDTFVLADSRGVASYARESIPGALSFPLADILSGGINAFVYPDATAIPLDTRLVFYCSGGT